MEKPYITLKFAETLDGKIAAKDGSSKWISGPKAREFTHGLRARNDAVLVGIDTVLADNPELTVRLVKGKNPARIIIDGKLRVPLHSKVIKSSHSAKTIIVTTWQASKGKAEKLRKKGIEVLFSPSKNNRINLRKAIGMLSDKGIKNILVEGGKKVITSFLRAGLVDRLVVIISPKILGSGVESIGDLGINTIKSILKLRMRSVKRLGEDTVFLMDVRKIGKN